MVRHAADDLLTSKETAASLRVDRATLDRWRRKGTGPPSVLIGGQRRYLRRDVENFKRARGPRAPGEPTFNIAEGICFVCSCTDAAGCPEGCSWVDADHTLCSVCLELVRSFFELLRRQR